MNERIRQLAEQAGMTDDKFGMYFAKDKHDEDGVDLEKFAELFVAECMEQINKVEEKGDAHLGGGYFYDGTRLCRDAIKQHFGVEL
jgi:hypothetical protein